MFTGIIQATGAIESVTPLAGGVHIVVDARGLHPRPIGIGDSIAVNGVCLTVTDRANDRFGADVSQETLSKTTGLDVTARDSGRRVNLETALALGDTLGGHLVSGHVDGVGTVVQCRPAGESVELVLRAPPELARLLAVKGSVTVDGVSLTVNRVGDEPGGACTVSINLIPHTLAVTGLQGLAAGSRVNLEIDLIARYVARMLEAPGARA